jgi:hypothetical protein
MAMADLFQSDVAPDFALHDDLSREVYCILGSAGQRDRDECGFTPDRISFHGWDSFPHFDSQSQLAGDQSAG